MTSRDDPSQACGAYGVRQAVGWLLGPAALAAVLLLPAPEGLSVSGWRTAGVAVLMATWWITESIPIPATALLPLVLSPLLGLGEVQVAAAPFANPVIYLFFGGFLLALALQRWNLHLRVAVGIIAVMGTRPHRIVAGFLVAASFVSLWVSNTATAMMLLPIALSVVRLVPAGGGPREPHRQFATALVLSVAYGATVGGMGTLIGTPPNALLAAYVEKAYGFRLGFGQWMLLGIPVVLVTLPFVHWVLTRFSFKLSHDEVPGMAALIAAERARLGPMRGPHWAVTGVFGLTALAWVFQPLLARALPMLTDTTIAMCGALLLFLIPVDARRGEFLLGWEASKDIPWDVLLLFGGGLSLSATMERHGLSAYLGSLVGGLHGVPVLVLVCVICFGILMLTELTSNTATAATFLPIAGAIALSLGENPLLFLIPTALAANCSFMLPVGTPPNAIVFGSGQVSLPQMARAGMVLNVVMVPVIVGLLLLLGGWVFGIELGTLPAWAAGR